MKGFRRQRAAELLRGFLGVELARSTDDRLARITLTEVDVSPDLRTAKIYWTTFETGPKAELTGPPPILTEDDKSVKEAREALHAARTELKRRIAQELDFRYVPTLHFTFDGSASQGARIDFLLQKSGALSSS
ncbi:MAG: ribosome-binding factor A [Deltaproteobacteria bacterium]|nr:ribosome-binding factor A [Deltaproteobacteria bacterium]